MLGFMVTTFLLGATLFGAGKYYHVDELIKDIYDDVVGDDTDVAKDDFGTSALIAARRAHPLDAEPKKKKKKKCQKASKELLDLEDTQTRRLKELLDFYYSEGYTNAEIERNINDFLLYETVREKK
eukprot:471167_1